MPYFLEPFIVGGHLGWFHFFATVNNAAIIWVCAGICGRISQISEYMLKSGAAG